MRWWWCRCRAQLLRKGKDETSLDRVCEPGFPWMPSFSDFAGREGFLFAAPATFKPRSGLSTKNRPQNSFSGQIERSPMKKNGLALALASLFLVPSIARAQFASAVISYDRGTGSAANFTNANAPLG